MTGAAKGSKIMRETSK